MCTVELIVKADGSILKDSEPVSQAGPRTVEEALREALRMANLMESTDKIKVIINLEAGVNRDGK